jgi:zinc transport system permease protein
MGAGEMFRVIVEEFPYALYGSVLVGLLCAYIGVFIVARRVVFMGAVMTQISILGLAVTFLPFLDIPHTMGSLVISLAAVAALSSFLTRRSVPGDAVLGVVFAAAIGLRILVLQKSPKVELSEIENLLRGDILFVTPELLYLLAAVFVAAMAVHLLFFKEFTYVTFDPETAAAQGFRAKLWETALFVIAAVAISVATHIVGDLFVFGFLVIPPVTGMLLARRVKGIFLVAVLVGAIVPAIGLYLAFVYDFPASPTIVVVATVVLMMGGLARMLRKG